MLVATEALVVALQVPPDGPIPKALRTHILRFLGPKDHII